MRPSLFMSNLSVGVGMAVAISCFAVLTNLLMLAGPVTTITALFCASLVALVVASCTAELASKYPGSMGIATYVRNAFGERVSNTVMYIYLAMILFIAGVEGALLGKVIDQFAGEGGGFFGLLVVYGIVLLANLRGHEFSMCTQFWLVAAIVVSIVLIAILAGIAAPVGNSSLWQAQEQVSALPEAVVVAVLLFVGFEWTTIAANQSRKSASTIPKVLIVSIISLAVFYIGFTIVAAYFIPVDGLSADTPLHIILASVTDHGFGVFLVITLTALSITTSFNAGLIGASKMGYALARDGSFPKIFAALNNNGVAQAGVICIVALCFAMSTLTYVVGTFRVFAEAAAILVCMVYIVILASYYKLRPVRANRASFVNLIPNSFVAVVAIVLMVAIVGVLFESHNVLLPILIFMVCFVSGLTSVVTRRPVENM